MEDLKRCPICNEIMAEDETFHCWQDAAEHLEKFTKSNFEASEAFELMKLEIEWLNSRLRNEMSKVFPQKS